MSRPSLSPQMTVRIIEHIRENNLARGHHLPTQTLADALRVSRAPIAAALKRLEELKIVRSEPYRGYFLAKDASELSKEDSPSLSDQEPEDEVYFQIAEDRLSRKLADRISENELMRLYGIPRSRLLKILHRIAEEGWIERLPGNGWEFRAGLTSRAGYEQAYQFRAAIESQSLLLPSFRIDPKAFHAAREEQQAILDGGFERMSRTHLFQANSQFHEMLVGCSQNEFFVDAVRRVNRLRRLIEYRITVNRSRLPLQSQEHLHILDLIEAGDRQRAAEFLRVHILGASAIKSPQLI
ncbi:GntR family transcriptional regulator [Microvirga lotononidis]|uniref:Transcriptional regulator n=1 Tax=Microvirga lotononidis TaxID=864069 RepID=I4YZK4_9HYPH|nr:GntR family transcriptional regulator [Microvirga lotononidis]EIM29396.1 transcriptional regulator [Microvirga lotononidis]WQO27281.1 GntR family transcriptional regulator [Microvirga lotononidis]